MVTSVQNSHCLQNIIKILNVCEKFSSRCHKHVMQWRRLCCWHDPERVTKKQEKRLQCSSLPVYCLDDLITILFQLSVYQRRPMPAVHLLPGTTTLFALKFNVFLEFKFTIDWTKIRSRFSFYTLIQIKAKNLFKHFNSVAVGLITLE